MQNNRQKVLVTGGAGYVGSGLIRSLLENEYSVTCVDSLLFGGESLLGVWHDRHFKFKRCDINDHEHLQEIFESEKYYAVVHLAAIVGDPACKLHPDISLQTNWVSSKKLLELSILHGVKRFIFASTCSNYGKMSGGSEFVTEDSPLAPVSLYAELKVKFENYMLHEIGTKHDVCATALRFSTVYGLSPRMRFDLTVNEFTKDLAMNRELLIFGEQFWRPYCHVRDFSLAFLTVLRSPAEKIANNVYNVGSTDENYTKKMIAELLLKEFPEAAIKYIPKDDDPRDYRVDFNKIKKDLGFVTTMKVSDGIREIREALRTGVFNDPDDQIYYNIPHERT